MRSAAPPSIARLVAPTAWLVAVAAGLPSLYLALLTALAPYGARRSRPESSGSTSFAICVPAHNEASVIDASVRALLDQRYPSSMFAVHVGLSPTPSVPAFAAERIEAIELDFNGFLAVSAESHALIISIVREARLYDVPITVKGITSALRFCLEDYGTWPMFAAARKW